MKQSHFNVLKLGLAIAGLTLFVTSCATPPKADSADDQRAETFEVKPGKANIYVYREDHFAGSGVVPQISLDDLPAGILGGGNYYRWEVPPGPHTLYAARPYHSGAKLNVDTEAGRNYFIEFRSHWGFSSATISLTLKNEEEAKREVGKCVLLQSQFGEVQ